MLFIDKFLDQYHDKTPYHGDLYDHEVVRLQALLHQNRRKKPGEWRVVLVGSSAVRDGLVLDKLKQALEKRLKGKTVNLIALTSENAAAVGESIFVHLAVHKLKPDLIIWGMMPPIDVGTKIPDSYVFKYFADDAFVKANGIRLSTESKKNLWLTNVVKHYRYRGILKQTMIVRLFPEYAKHYRHMIWEHRKMQTVDLKKMARDKKHFKYQTNHFKLDVKFMQLFKRAITLLNENKIPTICFNLPVAALQTAKYQNQLGEFKTTLKGWIKNAAFASFLPTPDTLPLKYYYDLAHLNETGRNLFTERFITKMNALIK